MNDQTPHSEVALKNKVMPLLLKFICFKQLAIRRLLQCDIELGLPPSFINHMINEALEFKSDLDKISMALPENSVMEILLLHKIWLPDAAGHAAAITAELDPTETSLIKEAETFQKIFDSLFIKAVELSQMLERSNLDNGALEWLNHEVIQSIQAFIQFLDKVKALRLKCKAMGTLNPLIPDHMIREEMYYLSNL